MSLATLVPCFNSFLKVISRISSLASGAEERDILENLDERPVAQRESAAQEASRLFRVMGAVQTADCSVQGVHVTRMGSQCSLYFLFHSY